MSVITFGVIVTLDFVSISVSVVDCVAVIVLEDTTVVVFEISCSVNTGCFCRRC